MCTDLLRAGQGIFKSAIGLDKTKTGPQVGTGLKPLNSTPGPALKPMLASGPKGAMGNAMPATASAKAPLTPTNRHPWEIEPPAALRGANSAQGAPPTANYNFGADAFSRPQRGTQREMDELFAHFRSLNNDPRMAPPRPPVPPAPASPAAPAKPAAMPQQLMTAGRGLLQSIPGASTLMSAGQNLMRGFNDPRNAPVRPPVPPTPAAPAAPPKAPAAPSEDPRTAKVRPPVPPNPYEGHRFQSQLERADRAGNTKEIARLMALAQKGDALMAGKGVPGEFSNPALDSYRQRRKLHSSGTDVNAFNSGRSDAARALAQNDLERQRPRRTTATTSAPPAAAPAAAGATGPSGPRAPKAPTLDDMAAEYRAASPARRKELDARVAGGDSVYKAMGMPERSKEDIINSFWGGAQNRPAWSTEAQQAGASRSSFRPRRRAY